MRFGLTGPGFGNRSKQCSSTMTALGVGLFRDRDVTPIRESAVAKACRRFASVLPPMNAAIEILPSVFLVGGCCRGPKRKQLGPPRAAFQVFLKRRPDVLSTVFTSFQGFHRLA
jgi:hypothetical protein